MFNGINSDLRKTDFPGTNRVSVDNMIAENFAETWDIQNKK